MHNSINTSTSGDIKTISLPYNQINKNLSNKIPSIMIESLYKISIIYQHSQSYSNKYANITAIIAKYFSIIIKPINSVNLYKMDSTASTPHSKQSPKDPFSMDPLKTKNSKGSNLKQSQASLLYAYKKRKSFVHPASSNIQITPKSITTALFSQVKQRDHQLIKMMDLLFTLFWIQKGS